MIDSLRPHCWTAGMAISPCSGCAWKEFLRLRSLGRLDLAKEYGELLLGKFVAAQQRFERVHQKHLNAHEFGKDMHVHLWLTGPFKVMQEPIAHPISERLSLRPRETLKRHILTLSETRR